jgi:hypothetical protein
MMISNSFFVRVVHSFLLLEVSEEIERVREKEKIKV